ncbi:hypothetical protein ACLB1M_23240 [Escherichia coli]
MLHRGSVRRSTDAVNGSQLYAVHRQTEGNTQAINNLEKIRSSE